MSTSLLFALARRAAVVSVVWVPLIWSVNSRAEADDCVVRSERLPAEARIRTVLAEPTEMAFIEAPLWDVILYLKDRHGIEIVPDQTVLDDAGIGTDTPVTIELSDTTLRSALNIVLRNLNLTYVVQDEVLLITTPNEQRKRLITRVYSVGDLVEDASADELIDVLRAWRNDTSGAGRILAYRDLLLVRDTDHAHQELVKLLGLMRDQIEE